MTNYLVTGFTGQDVTASLDAHMHAAMVGVGSYVTALGSQLAASIVDANTIRLADGALFFQGLFACIPTGQTADVALESGSQGQNRLDLIGFQYTKDVTTGQEQGTFVALKGTPVAGTPEPPAYTAGDCLSGAVSAFLPLYLVRLTGIAVESVTRHWQWQSLTPVSQANQTSAALASQLTQVQQQYAGLVLVPGDSIYVRNVFCAGGVTGGGKNLYFFIPLSRTPVGVTTVTLTNPDTANVTARKVSGGYIADGKTVGTMGTVTCDIRPNGVAVSIRSETVYDVVNNTPAVVEADKFNLAFA
ncbi:MAG: hypothetical protein Q4G01_01920 [Eubacteriales bacterium]|nr:hypothetical protein [Eubacteriales bacterium]